MIKSGDKIKCVHYDASQASMAPYLRIGLVYTVQSSDRWMGLEWLLIDNHYWYPAHFFRKTINLSYREIL